MQRTFRWLTYAFLTLFSVLLFFHLNAGSIPNSDDALYAEISRNVGRGSFWPLRFAENPYWAKPPLYFWVSGLFHRVLPLSGEAPARFLSALSVFGTLLLSFLIFWRRSGLLVAYGVALALASSPFLMWFSYRVMLDPLFILLSVAALFAASSNRGASIPGFWALAAAAWWIREFAILPVIAAVLIFWFLIDPTRFKKKSFWVGFGVFCASTALLVILRKGSMSAILPAAQIVRSNPTPSQMESASYFEWLRADSPLLWGFPLAMFWLLYRRGKTLEGPAPLFGLAALLSFAAVFATKTVLPHYVLPAVVYALITTAVVLVSSTPRKIALASLVGIAILAGKANGFRFNPSSEEIDSAPATKAISIAAKKAVPAEFPICVIDAYFVGFQYYADRTVRGFYTSDYYFKSLMKVDEFRGRIDRVRIDDLDSVILEDCGGFGVLPSAEIERLSVPAKTLAEAGSLRLIQLAR